MSQLLHIKIVTIIFVILLFFMLPFVAQKLTYSQIPKYHNVYQGYASVFQVGDIMQNKWNIPDSP